MFVFCAVQGSIALVAPFHVHHKEYLRDCFFYFLSIVGTGFVLLDGKIVMLEGLVLYVFSLSPARARSLFLSLCYMPFFFFVFACAVVRILSAYVLGKLLAWMEAQQS
jgi:Ca2+/Na+ antiporter